MAASLSTSLSSSLARAVWTGNGDLIEFMEMNGEGLDVSAAADAYPIIEHLEEGMAKNLSGY